MKKRKVKKVKKMKFFDVVAEGKVRVNFDEEIVIFGARDNEMMIPVNDNELHVEDRDELEESLILAWIVDQIEDGAAYFLAVNPRTDEVTEVELEDGMALTDIRDEIIFDILNVLLDSED